MHVIRLFIRQLPGLTNVTESMARLDLVTGSVLELRDHVVDCPPGLSTQLDDVLQEIRDLAQEMDVHEELQATRWKELESLGLCLGCMPE
jgi:hypothetical protein